MSPRAGQTTRSTSFQADVPLPAATETVVAAIAGLSTDGNADRIEVHGWAQCSDAAGVTNLTARVRRGVDTTGVLVGEANPIAAAASQVVQVDIDVIDAPGDVAGQGYVLTVTATGGASSAQQGELSTTIGV